MIGVKETQNKYLAAFDLLEKRLAEGEGSWMRQLRRRAIRRFAELGFPTTRMEEWKYTNVAPIARVDFQTADVNQSTGDEDGLFRAKAQRRKDRKEEGPKFAGVDLAHSPLAGLDAIRLAFINGRFSRELSSLDRLPAGITAGSLAEYLGSEGNSAQAHLARYADFENQAFAALNTAFLEDGAFVEIAKGVVLEKPIHLFYIATTGEQPAASHPRSLIIAGRESQAIIIEEYITLNQSTGVGTGRFTSGREDDFRFEIRNFKNAAAEAQRRQEREGERPSVTGFEGITFTNAVTEIVAGENSVIEYYSLQQQSEQAFHVATVQAQQARNSNFTSHSLTLGGALVRNDFNVTLDGEGAECTLNGLYVTGGKQHVDNHTRIDHAKPHGTSRELYKGILDGSSTAVFNGAVIVRKDAQKTDASQSNKNLLLSKDAAINTKPQLEIFADDVKCTHGATIGQLDREAVFYLRSRGIAADVARRMLTTGFATEVLDRMRNEAVRARLEEALAARLWFMEPK